MGNILIRLSRYTTCCLNRIPINWRCTGFISALETYATERIRSAFPRFERWRVQKSFRPERSRWIPQRVTRKRGSTRSRLRSCRGRGRFAY